MRVHLSEDMLTVDAPRRRGVAGRAAAPRGLRRVQRARRPGAGGARRWRGRRGGARAATSLLGGVPPAGRAPDGGGAGRRALGCPGWLPVAGDGRGGADRDRVLPPRGARWRPTLRRRVAVLPAWSALPPRRGGRGPRGAEGVRAGGREPGRRHCRPTSVAGALADLSDDESADLAEALRREMARWRPVTRWGRTTTGVLALACLGEPGGRAGAGARPRDEAFKMVDAYIVSNLQESLGLSDEQFAQDPPARQAAAERPARAGPAPRPCPGGDAARAGVGDRDRGARARPVEGGQGRGDRRSTETIRRDMDAIDRC